MNFITAQVPGSQYIVVDELTPEPGNKNGALEKLRYLSREAEKSVQVLSFWVLQRGDEENDDSLLVFARYGNKHEWSAFEDVSSAETWKAVYRLCSEKRRTTWIDSGLGFLGR